MKSKFLLTLLVLPLIVLTAGAPARKANPPIYIAFLWHMHQPVYYPGKSVVETDQLGYFPFSVADIHNQRVGPYTTWPRNAVQKGVALPHFGAQVSLTGSLIENLNALESAGSKNFTGWKSAWTQSRSMTTTLGNPRLDLIGFGYFHPLMGLLETDDIRKQIAKHRQTILSTFGGPVSKGIFPPENAFSPRMIPGLRDEGIEWALVDNIHFERAAAGYPFNTGGNLYEPNKADIRNPNPNDWIQLNGVWAPTRVSARWARQPHWVEYIDPVTGAASRIIAVPADRYLGNEDGRGGFGALSYESVMSQFESSNTDPARPILLVLHHDGDNYGGGTDSYYGSNFQAFVEWLGANPTRFVCTTIQDYLAAFPPDSSDVIHVEDGSWSGADNGDPEFKKWLGDPDNTGYSPDRNSWGVLTAAKNIVATAEQMDSTAAAPARNFLMVSQASDYWYWDGSLGGKWDVQPTRGANLAVGIAQPIIVNATDGTPPTIFAPQREPYNPGATEWNVAQPSAMTVWTYVYDVSGLQSVKLKYRIDADGAISVGSKENFTYAGGVGVGGWISMDMTGTVRSSSTDPAPTVKALEYSVQLTGVTEKLVDYYVEAVDAKGNLARSPISHVWIGPFKPGGGGGGGGTYGVTWSPLNPTRNDSVKITITSATQGGWLHWGVNNAGSVWEKPDSVFRPAGSIVYNGTGPAVETPFIGPDTSGTLRVTLGPFNKTPLVAIDTTAPVRWSPPYPSNNDTVTIIVRNTPSGGKLHWGVNNTGGTWQLPDPVYRPAGTIVFPGNGAVQTIMNGPDGTGTLRLKIGPFNRPEQSVSRLAFVIAFDNGTWDNNKSLDYHIDFSATGPKPQVVDRIAFVVRYQNGTWDNNSGQDYHIEVAAPASVSAGISVPAATGLHQNYPNPFNPTTAISYQLSAVSDVTLKVFDMLGREVATLVKDEQAAGEYVMPFPGERHGMPLNSGVYFYRLEVKPNDEPAAHFIETKKMLLLK